MVCLDNGCARCIDGTFPKYVPNDCPIGILHALETKVVGIRPMRRQSGKTTQLVEMANTIVAAGYTTYMVTVNQEMVRRMERQYGLSPRVICESEFTSSHREGWSTPGYVLFDEIQPWGVRRAMNHRAGSLLVAAYFTPV